MTLATTFVAPRLSAAAMQANNAACRLAALAAHEFGLPLAIGRGTAEAGDSFEVALEVNGAEALLVVPTRLLQRCAKDFLGAVRDHEIPGPLLAAMLEATVAPLLHRLEKTAGIEIAIRRFALAPENAAADAPLAFTLPGIDDGAIAVTIPGTLAPSRLPSVAWTSDASIALRFPLVLEEVDVTVAEFAGLAPGDIVMLPGVDAQKAQVAIPILPGTAIIAHVDDSRLVVDRAGKTMSTSDAGNGANPPSAAKAADAKPAEPVVPANTVDELPLKVVFDLGDLELSIAELKALVPGQVIDLARAPGSAVRVSVNGRRIGTGEIVEIEGRLGVRITELGSRNERPAS